MRLFAIPLLLLATPALAQSPAAMMACVKIASDTERLACFDKAMASTSPEARATSEKRAAEATEAALVAAAAAKDKAEAAAAAQRDSFGAEAVASSSTRFEAPAGELQELETSVTELLTNSSGQWLFLLENSQLWKQADTSRVPHVRVGDRVKVTRAALGGYHLNFLKQKVWVLVKRVR